jgi:hypothetical protein
MCFLSLAKKKRKHKIVILLSKVRQSQSVCGEGVLVIRGERLESSSSCVSGNVKGEGQVRFSKLRKLKLLVFWGKEVWFVWMGCGETDLFKVTRREEFKNFKGATVFLVGCSL